MICGLALLPIQNLGYAYALNPWRTIIQAISSCKRRQKLKAKKFSLMFSPLRQIDEAIEPLTRVMIK